MGGRSPLLRSSEFSTSGRQNSVVGSERLKIVVERKFYCVDRESFERIVPGMGMAWSTKIANRVRTDLGRESENPHPLKGTKGAAPKGRLAFEVLRTWGAAVLRPYMFLCLGGTGDESVGLRQGCEEVEVAGGAEIDRS
jgi:hypothetical protein